LLKLVEFTLDNLVISVVKMTRFCSVVFYLNGIEFWRHFNRDTVYIKRRTNLQAFQLYNFAF